MKRVTTIALMLFVVISAAIASPYSGSVVTKAYPKISRPVVGEKPITTGTMPSNASSQINRVEWIGNFDSNGCFKAGESYTIRVHLAIKSGMSKVFKNSQNSDWKINGVKATFVAVPGSNGKKCYLEAKTQRLGMDQKVITSAALSIPKPVAGAKPSNTATISSADDLEIVRVQWSGPLDAEGNFKTNSGYTATIVFRVKQGSIGSFSLSHNDNNFTVNGEQVALADAKEGYGAVVYRTSVGNSKTYLDLTKIYSKEQADSFYWEYHTKTCDVKKVHAQQVAEWAPTPVPTEWYLDQHLKSRLEKNETFYITKLLVNIEDSSSVKYMLYTFPNIQEIWYGPEVDFAKVLQSFVSLKTNPPYSVSSKGATTQNVTIFLPAEKYPKGLLSIQEELKDEYNWKRSIPTQALWFNVRLYHGNFDQAVNKGASATTTFCPGHDYSAQVTAAHTVMRHPTCQVNLKFYYSCKYCGKVEHNPKHVFEENPQRTHVTKPLSHAYIMQDLSSRHYIGRNSKGEKVYRKSCYYCGIDGREAILSYTQAELEKNFGRDTERTLEQFKASTLKAWDGPYKQEALEGTFWGSTYPGYFAVPEDDHGAKVSDKGESDTKWAMVYGLIDKQVLGDDYSKNITTLQMASLAVRLAENVSEVPISPKQAEGDIYIRKALAAGIIAENYNPTALVTRQQMATYIYRAMEYIKKNSSIRYTIWSPQLDQFTDKGQIAQYAFEPMAFLNVLGLIKGTTKTTISPNNNCTIEEAVILTKKSYHADRLGLYQCLRPDERGYAGSPGGWWNKLVRVFPHGDSEVAIRDYSNFDRIWVDEDWIAIDMYKPKQSRVHLSFIDEYTGTHVFVDGQDFLPIKDL